MLKKRKNKTKEELVKDAELKKEAERQRKFVKEIFYPFLLSKTENIEDAKRMCVAAGQAVQFAYDNQMLEEQKRLSKSQVSVLNVNEMIDSNVRYDRDRELIKMFEHEGISTAVQLLNGMSREIEGFLKDENKERKLETVKTNWL